MALGAAALASIVDEGKPDTQATGHVCCFWGKIGAMPAGAQCLEGGMVWGRSPKV